MASRKHDVDEGKEQEEEKVGPVEKLRINVKVNDEEKAMIRFGGKIKHNLLRND